MHILRKSMILMMMLGIGVFATPFVTTAQIISEETIDIEGAAYQRIQQDLGGGIKQTIHVLGADFSLGAYRIIVGDQYSTTAFGTATTMTHAQVSESRFDEYMIIGGVNGDYFEGAGVPQEAYIRNGEVLSSGIGYPARDVIGIKADGTVVHGRPVFEGHEVVVVDPNGKERIRIPLTNINSQYMTSPHDVYAYFDTFSQTLPSGVNKYILETSETKGAMPKIYGRGTVIQRDRLSSYDIPQGHMVIASNNIYLDTLVEQGDIITVQRRMVGDFEGVRWAIGAYGKLMADGEVLETIVGIDPTFRAPRTGVDIKADGSMFFIVVDGRQPGYSNGATLYELAEMMKERGAIAAYNLDGGGSSTMVLRNDSNAFYVANQPSDGVMRPVTNSIFLAVQVRFDDKTPYPIPDLSVPLETPTNLSVDRGILSWDAIDNRTRYEITINDNNYESLASTLDLRKIIASPGTYDIRVKAIGDGTFFRTSSESETLNYIYNGPETLKDPSHFVFANGVLYWDQDDPQGRYQVIVNGLTFNLTVNRINLQVRNLEPGIYPIEVRAVGDGYNTEDSQTSIYVHRVYSATEQEVQETLKLILEILYQRSKK